MLETCYELVPRTGRNSLLCLLLRMEGREWGLGSLNLHNSYVNLQCVHSDHSLQANFWLPLICAAASAVQEIGMPSLSPTMTQVSFTCLLLRLRIYPGGLLYRIIGKGKTILFSVLSESDLFVLWIIEPQIFLLMKDNNVRVVIYINLCYCSP